MLFSRKSKDYSQLSDEELITLYQDDREEACIGVLYERHYDKIYVVARNMLKDREAAKDVVMTVFEKVMKNLGSTDVQSFSNWLFIITKNECNQYLRKTSNNVKKMSAFGDFQKNTIVDYTGYTEKEVKSYLQNGKKNLEKILTPKR